MTVKVPFLKLERTCSECPSQWEYMSPQKDFSCYIRYRWDKLTINVCQNQNQQEFDCLDKKNMILCIENLSGEPACGYLSDYELYEILAHHNILEEE